MEKVMYWKMLLVLAASTLASCRDQAPRDLDVPLSYVARQSDDRFDLTIDGRAFLYIGRPDNGLDGVSAWARSRVNRGELVEESSTFSSYYSELRFAQYGPFGDINVTDPSYVEWEILAGTEARNFRVNSPICAGNTGGSYLTIKCPEIDPVLITSEVLLGISRMIGLEQISITGMYAGTQEDLIDGLQAIIDVHDPKSLVLGFVSEDGIAPNVCALEFGDALTVLNWVALASDFDPKFEFTLSAAPTTIFSPFDIVQMQVQGEEVSTFQQEICGD